jgi:hypothetical protein
MRTSPATRPARWLLPALAALLFAAGCGKSGGTITGTVTYKGQALKGGMVVFTPADGGNPISAEIQPDGTYTIEKVPVGAAKVSVQTAYLKPVPGGAGRGYGPPPDAPNEAGYKPPDPSGTKDKYTAIPSQYEEAATSGLTYTVTSGSQKHDITLE